MVTPINNGGKIIEAVDGARMVGTGTYYIVATFEETKCSVQHTVEIKAVECPKGEEGCTLGYWKNHTDRWCSNYSPTTPFTSVFSDVPLALRGITLLDALNLGGGGIYNLARQGVAALLNACSEDVDYALKEAAVIKAVSDAFRDGTAGAVAKELDEFNNAGCPLGGTRATKSISGGSVESPLKGVETLEGTQLTAYPTPFADKATIEFRFVKDENYTINLYDMKGSVVKQLKAGVARAGEVNQVEVDGRTLPEGLYIARMMSDSGVKTVKLLLKKQ